jgi:hypothetical protein
MFPERFALTTSGPTSSPGVGPLIPSKTSLSPTKWYYTYSLNAGRQVFTSTGAINGGASCVSFPTSVYREVPSSLTTYSLVSEIDWYPYGTTLTIAKNAPGVNITTLASAIIYANNNGFTAFSFNETPSSTNPNINDPNILFFREPDINSNTFWTNGAAIPRFRVYAIGFSKLRTTMTCPPNQTRINGVCTWNACPTNQTRINNVCQWNACPTNSTLNTTTGDCTCNSTFQKAPGNTGRNEPCFPICTERCSTMQSNGTCLVPFCPAEQSLGADCVCRWNACTITGQTRGSDNICRCPTEQSPVNNVCQWNSCPTNSTLNTTTGDCSCNPSFQKAPGRTGRNEPCFRTCIIPGQSMGFDGICRCPSDQEVINGVCSCISKQVLINGMCQCPAGSTMRTLTSGVKECVCTNTEQTLVNGVCQWNLCKITGQVRGGDGICRCTNDKILSGTSCVCPSGTTDRGTYCECSGNKTLSGGNCVCPFGSTEINGVCTCTLSGQIMTRNNSTTSCSCPAGQTYDWFTSKCTSFSSAWG